MQLKQIDILNYKSITSPVSIKFKEGEVVTLIGKNGSGKTNILEALEQIFKSNAKQIFYHNIPPYFNPSRTNQSNIAKDRQSKTLSVFLYVSFSI